MTPKAVGRDLLLLGGVMAAPIRQWKDWRDVAVEFLGEGGAMITTPPVDHENQPVLARTIVQPDGDVLVIVDRAALIDASVLTAHQHRVDEWYRRRTVVVRQAAIAFKALAIAIGAVMALPAGWVTGQRLGWALAPVVISGLSWPIGRLLRWPVRALAGRRIKRMLGQVAFPPDAA